MLEALGDCVRQEFGLPTNRAVMKLMGTNGTYMPMVWTGTLQGSVPFVAKTATAGATILQELIQEEVLEMQVSNCHSTAISAIGTLVDRKMCDCGCGFVAAAAAVCLGCVAATVVVPLAKLAADSNILKKPLPLKEGVRHLDMLSA